MGWLPVRVSPLAGSFGARVSTRADLEPEITEVLLALESAGMDVGPMSLWASPDPGSVRADQALVATGVRLAMGASGASLETGSAKDRSLFVPFRA